MLYFLQKFLLKFNSDFVLGLLYNLLIISHSVFPVIFSKGFWRLFSRVVSEFSCCNPFGISPRVFPRITASVYPKIFWSLKWVLFCNLWQILRSSFKKSLENIWWNSDGISRATARRIIEKITFGRNPEKKMRYHRKKVENSLEHLSKQLAGAA